MNYMIQNKDGMFWNSIKSEWVSLENSYAWYDIEEAKTVYNELIKTDPSTYRIISYNSDTIKHKEPQIDSKSETFRDMTPDSMQLFHNNYKQFASAFIDAGEHSVNILNDVEEFMRILVINNISITATHQRKF